MCRVLSLSGGGTKGPYEVGAINELYRTLGAPDNQYDVIVGVSVGSINAFGYSVFEKGEELEAADFMESKWLGLTTSRIWEFWNNIPIFDIVLGLFMPGFVNDQPMYDFVYGIKKEMGEVKKKIVVSAVDSITGATVGFPLHLEGLTDEYMTTAVIGSASMPGIFPPRNMSQFGLPYNLIDGGSAWNNNMIHGIKECMKKPGITDYSQIHLDVITLNPKKPVPDFVDGQTTIKNFYMAYKLKNCKRHLNDIIEFKKAHPMINYRYLLIPEYTVLSPVNELFVNKKQTRELLERGKVDMIRVLAMGPGKSWNLLSENEMS